MTKISIIIPVYKVEDYLRGCLDSVYPQLTDECEVILVDDGSPDNCGKICDEYKEKHPDNTTVIHQENTGNGGARNAGINASCGEYLFFIDSDDTIVPDAIATLLNTIEEIGADVILFSSKSVSEDGTVLSYSNDPFEAGQVLEVERHKSVLIASPAPWNRITRASLFKEHNIEFPSRVWYEDIRTTVKTVGLAKTAYYINRPLYNYLHRSGSIMNNANVEKNGEIIAAMDDLREFFTSEGIYEKFRNELEFLIIDHVFVAATVRVLRVSPKTHHLVKEFRDYTFRHCSDVADNPYVATMTGTRRLVFKLLLKKMYSAVILIFRYIKK